MTAPPLFHLHRGTGPLVISVPHAGTYIPDDIANELTPAGRAVIDTDWHVDRLYDFAPSLSATLIVATHARTVVDLNRGPGGERLYPGQAETGICPTETFAGLPLYDRDPPDNTALAYRIATYWQPYHDALQAALHRVRAACGTVRLLDAHSIRGQVPRLFAGALPDLNFGTHDGVACRSEIAGRAIAVTADQGFSHVLNGRFRGGYITRHYGCPTEGIDAIQLELAQRTYMNEAAPGPYDAIRAAPLVAVLRHLVTELLSI
jgi:N-formylglutamate deformylase